MRAIIIRILNKVVRVLSPAVSVPDKATPTPESIQAERVIPWFRDDGDKTHRLKYELDSTSFVMDLGGYEGQWASDIYSMYNCKVWIFEPLPEFFQKIASRFERNPNIKAFRCGLGPRTEKLELAILDNSSSIFQQGDIKEIVEIESIGDFLAQHQITSVDLIKINIEGAEYELLEDLLDKGLITIFKNIQVQFHDFIIPNAASRMAQIHQRLSATHELTYHYNFVWDNWRLRTL